MGTYDFLNTMNKEQLLCLRESTTDENLKQAVNNLLTSPLNSSFKSDREIYINLENEGKYREIIKNLKIDELPFLSRLVFSAPYNTKPNYRYKTLDVCALIYHNEAIKKLAHEKYGLHSYVEFYLAFVMGNTKNRNSAPEISLTDLKNEPLILELLNRVQSFSYLEEFFQNKLNQVLYEGCYNSYMYVKEYIFQMLMLYPNLTKEDILADWQTKLELVMSEFFAICNYLYQARSKVPNGRLSACNDKIVYYAKYPHEKFNDKQELFSSMLSFGTTLDKIKEKNYEDYKRLIYVPRDFYKKEK